MFPPIRHDGRVLVDGAVVDTVPLSHALAGPGRPHLRAQHRPVTCSHRRCGRRSTSPIRAFAISRKQRFELEVQHVPERSSSSCSRVRPTTARLISTSPVPTVCIELSYRLAEQTLDDAELARSKRLTLRRPWWRRDAG